MRFTLIIIAGLLGCGCAAQNSFQSANRTTAPANVAQIDSPALALACEPALVIGQPALYLDREPREASAFAGYSQSSVTYSYTRTDDNYTPFANGQFNRQALSETVAVTTR